MVRKLLCSIIIFIYFFPVATVYAKCLYKLNAYKVVDKSVYPFEVGKERTCFFAFYTKNPDPSTDVKGNGNTGDAIWYGYYKLNNPSKIYEFPKPLTTDWSGVCTIEAISFYSMHPSSNKRDVTVIGSCNKNAIHYTMPFVFTWENNKFILDEDVYSSLYGFIGLTVTDVRNYIRSPNRYYVFLRDRYKP